MRELPSPVDDGGCVGCGRHNPSGLQMRFATNADGSVTSDVIVPALFQGWRDVVHGGVVALLLDEAMAYAAAARGHLGVTADLKLRFRKPVPVGAALSVNATVLWQRRDVFGIEANVKDAAGTLLAAAVGSFVSRGLLGPGERLGEPAVYGRA